MTQKRILHLTSSLKIGGAETLLHAMIGRLPADLFEQAVISFHDGPYAHYIRELGVPVTIIRGRFFQYDPIFFVRLFRAIKKADPDCIHSLLWAANVFGRLFARMLRIPSISVMHLSPDHGALRNVLDRMSLLAPTHAVAVSLNVAQSFIQRDQWLAARRVTVIENGIDAAGVRARGLTMRIDRAAVGLGPEHFIIGSVGRLSPQKNYTLLLRSFALIALSHPHARLMILGHGPQEQMLRALAFELGIADKVIFIIGQLAYGYFSLFDCFILSSNQEGMSIALLEAMSFGLPCIVTHDGGVLGAQKHAVLTHEYDGLVIPVGDEKAIVKAIDMIIRNDRLRRDLGKNAAATVSSRLSLDMMVEAYQKLFKTMARE